MSFVLSRRAFLGSALAGASAFVGPRKAFGQSRGSKRPNVVIILADDMGFSDLGCFGSEIETPNLDRMAAEGIRFSQGYSAARCCPTRACLLTGVYPHQAGIGHMTNEENRRFDYGFDAYRGDLSRRCVTIAEVLNGAGYQTWMTGKWHVGTPKGMWPLDRGFEKYFGIVRGACNYFKPGDDKLLTEGRTPVKEVGEDFYTTDAFTDHAIRFVEERDDDKPFFLYLAYNAPHWPLNAWPEDAAKYKGRYDGGWDRLREARFAKQKSLGLATDAWQLTPRDREVPAWENVPEEKRKEMAYRMELYAAQVDRLDQNVGRFLKALKKADALENTLIIFLSDNGGCAEGGNFGGGPAEELGTRKGYFLTYGRGWANASNTPFERYKHWVHEGGISSPMIAHWPAAMPKEKKGTFCREYVHLIDFMATAVDVAEADYPKTFGEHAIQGMEGKSLAPLLKGAEGPVHNVVFWEHEGNRAVRKGKWKLVSAHARGDKKWHLYDMERDRSEQNDLIAKEPEVAAELSRLYDAWAKRCGVLPWPVKE